MTSCELCVPEWSPLFEGHFPGQPILAGVAQLVLVERVLARLIPGRATKRLERVRFKATCGPRETLRVELDVPGQGERVRVRLHGAAGLVMEGVLRVA